MLGQGYFTENLRNRQIGMSLIIIMYISNLAALKQVLNLNQPVSNSLAVEPVWKLLILDSYGKDIISPLIKVKQLRELGVTLHL